MSSSSEGSLIKDLGRSWPGFLLSIISLVLVFSIADWGTLRESIWLADYRYFVPAIVVFFISIGMRSLAWKTLLKDRVSIRRSFIVLNEGYLLNNLLPFRLGEVGRAFLMSRTAQIEFLQVASTILIERAIDLIMVVGLLLATVPLVIGADWARPTAILVGIVVLTGLSGLYLLARFQQRVLGWLSILQARFRVLEHIDQDFVSPFFEGLAALTDFGRFLRTLLIMMVTWAMIVLHYYLVLLAFLPEGKLLWAAFGIGVVGLGVAVPSAPGSIGIVQGAIVGVFPLVFGVDPAVALAFALTVHALYLVITSGIGIIGLLRDGESLAGVYRDIRRYARRLRTRQAETA